MNPLRFVPYHFFQLGGRWHLFGIRSLVAIEAHEVDTLLLKAVGDRSQMTDISERFGKATVEKRMRRLIDNAFLVPADSSESEPSPISTSHDATFMIGLSHQCNLSCRYCYVNEGQFDYKEHSAFNMNQETCDTSIDAAFSMIPGFQSCCFHFYGGEPTMNMPGMRRMVRLAKETGNNHGVAVEFAVTTNGTRIDDDTADFFQRNRFTVYLSIDGDERRHDENRMFRNRLGSFQATLRGLKKLVDRPDVHLYGSAVITQSLSLGEALDLLESYGVKHAKAERIRVAGGNPLAPDAASRARYIEDVHSLVGRYCHALDTGTTPIDTRLISKILQLFSKQRRTHFCQAGRSIFGISANGGIYPCALLFGNPDYRFGDVWKGLHGPNLARFRRRFGAANRKACGECWAAALCGGGCPAMTERFGRDDCDVLKAEAESAIAVYTRYGETDPMRLLGVLHPGMADWVATGRAANVS